MRSRLIRGGAAFVLAGLTTWQTAWGQEFGFVPAVPPAAAPAPAAGTTDQFQVLSLLIEMELLADSATFPYHLKVVPVEQGVALRGYLPSALVRDRALAAARRVCPVPVLDGLVLQRNMALPLPTRLPKDVEIQVRQKLAEVCPEAVVDVKVNESGTAHLTGMVPSLQQKAECSRALRKVPGVTAVRNHLEIGQGIAAHRASPVIPVEMPRPFPPPTEPVVAQANSSVSPVTMTSTHRPATTQAFAERSEVPVPSSPSNYRPAPLPPLPEPPRRSTVMPPPPVTPAPGTLASEIAERTRSTPEIQQVAATETASPVAAKVPDRPAAAPTKPTPPAGSMPFGVAPIPDARTQSVMKTKIHNVVGPQLRMVDLLFDGRGGVTLILYIDKDANMDHAINRIIQVPELSGYELRMDFKMVQ
jgi:hypothetical protein